MSRQNFPHNYGSLVQLSAELGNWSKEVRAVADRVRKVLKDEDLSLAHQATIDRGLRALQDLCAEARLKLDRMERDR